MSRPLVIFLHRGAWPDRYQAVTLAIAAAALGDPVTLALHFEPLRLWVEGRFDEGAPVEAAAARVGSLAEALDEARRELGLTVVACETAVLLAGVAPERAAARLDAVHDAPLAVEGRPRRPARRESGADRPLAAPERARYTPASMSHSEKTVLVIGAGGLGGPALLTLAQGGVGRIVLVEDDVVDPSNLARQPLFDERDVGARKAAVAAARLRALFPATAVEARDERFGPENALELARAADVLVDGSDNFATKFLASDVAVARAQAARAWRRAAHDRAGADHRARRPRRLPALPVRGAAAGGRGAALLAGRRARHHRRVRGGAMARRRSGSSPASGARTRGGSSRSRRRARAAGSCWSASARAAPAARAPCRSAPRPPPQVIQSRRARWRASPPGGPA